MSVQRKTGYEIIKGKKDTPDAIEIGGKPLKFDNRGMMIVEDKGVADEIETRYGAHSKTGDGSVFVCEVDNPGTREARRVFTFSRIPWKDD